MKSQPNSSQFELKINQNPDQFLYYPFIEIDRKSLKIDNKLTQNQ